MNKLLETLAIPWTRRWSGQVAASAVVFWTLGAYLVLVTGPDRSRGCPARNDGLLVVWCRAERYGTTGLVLTGLLATAAVLGSALVVAASAPRVLELFTSDHRGGPVSRWLLHRALARRRRISRVTPPAVARQPPTPTPDPGLLERLPVVGKRLARRRRLVRAERRRSREVQEERRSSAASAELRRYPRADALLAPTRVGCLLAALTERVEHRHGLDLPLCWELFLAVLPAEPRRRLEDEARRVTVRVQILVWTSAALLWTPLFPGGWRAVWVLAVLLFVRIAHSGLRDAVEVYCDLVEVSVALHRDRMYTALGWTPPESTAAERDLGRALSAYLDGHTSDSRPLTWPDPQPPLPVTLTPGA
ncbi:hypothetical protein E1200_04125 [Actinomadura sp. GC306]|uniref:hypothetical protein n=1 Tax=Actinomadura sp. GC306 TaxID=2530367 RepID=UPI00104B6213|nr:hypothetical protein [Actinomadura sp. GC306]TDC70801.1 hypothetical protein E1200_04125 [Actinomadura sp. GC306]